MAELQSKEGFWKPEGLGTESPHVWCLLQVNIEVIIIAGSSWRAQKDCENQRKGSEI